ncbi:septation ring formation regulator EzrA [Sphaerisporangium siamense]|uniref:Cell division protein FtsB n=1 Tax=Sphaerisporangium siamense TaxID=795645 RepID=A0A7W7D6A3_9ACTN|nr:septum formation initiator family protein [Sphaerisporangium siamense]MBB4700774.1 cell division protein FtsB [Sphaerisporangium siamense]GII88826.1 septation ring formation regulator EzrA [Sphaerisporangium siamense]
MKKRPQLTGRAAILAVVVCAIAMSLAYPVREFVAQRRLIAQLEHQQAQALKDLQELGERGRQLSDREYLARLAKSRLHFCEAGEKCIVVRDTSKKAARPQAGATPSPSPPWYQTLWESVEAADRGTGRRAEPARTPAP